MVMLTELDRSVIIAISCGFIGGLSQSVLEDVFSTKIDKQIKSLEIIIKKSLSSGFGAGIIMGIVTFALASWDSNMSIAELNRFSIFVPLAFPLSVILNRILPLHSILLSILDRKNKTNN